jgi:Zn-dependent protease/CBS domain-containing protein
MFGRRWRLFRLFGIPVSVDLSWLIILALITWTVADLFQQEPQFLKPLYPAGGLGLSEPGYLLMGLAAALLFFGCILLHEMGHALVARSVGMPIRGITLFLFGGVAELGDEPPSAGSEFAMAIAGPLVSVVLALVCGLLAWSNVSASLPHVVVIILAYLAFINGAVLVLNMIPAFPLDGGRVLRSILWGAMGNLRRATRWAAWLGQVFAWLLIISGVLRLFWGDIIGGLWSGLIGMFLNSAARSSYQQILVRQALEGEPVRRFMNSDPVTVPPDLDLRRWVEEYVYRYHRKAFPVVADGRLEGYVTTQALAHYPRSEWGAHTVGEVMEHELRPVSIAPDADAVRALGQMQRTGLSRLLVVEGDRLVGLVSLKDLLRFLHLKLELEGDEGGRRPPPLHGPTRRETPAPQP